MIWPLLDSWAEMHQIFVLVFGKFKTPKSHSEISWLLAIYSNLLELLNGQKKRVSLHLYLQNLISNSLFLNLYWIKVRKEWKKQLWYRCTNKKVLCTKKWLAMNLCFTSKEGRWLWKVRLMRQNIFLRARQTDLFKMDLSVMLEQAHLETIFYKYIFTRKFAVEMAAKLKSVWI